ncbi:hypothetical protein [Paenibacillus sp. y28]|uniref:hypothetical protein n=1 Tax=Paenibacillus sp. y28 TaxID=3129110 RepID=UPI003017A534
MRGLLALLLIIALAGCTEPEWKQSEAAGLLLQKGYRLIAYEGQVQSYVLTREKLTELPYMVYWGLQQAEPADYIGKTIEVEKFIVRKHPLSEGKVDVFVYTVEGRPVGGTSYPHKAVLAGGYWSLEGRTLEEIQDKPFQEWRLDWAKKYGPGEGAESGSEALNGGQ